MFKKDFVWGVASASYQVEGAAFEDGKGLSIWDVFSNIPGKVWESHTGNEACDHYNRFKEDVKIMKELGIQAYRLSISWPRIMPNGVGEVNEKGIEFYNNLLDELIENGIEPYVTLFHWDLPYELYKKGHYLNSDFSNWFEEYTNVILENFGSKIKNIFTLNEPQCFVYLGFGNGVHAPGYQFFDVDLIQMAHNSLLAHGKAVRAIRAYDSNIKVGYAPVGVIKIPNTDKKEDVDAARHAMFEIEEDAGAWDIFWSNALWNDPIFFGKYPEVVLDRYKDFLPDTLEEDLKIISQPVDMFGCNIYNGREVEMANGRPQAAMRKVGYDITGYDWPVTPKALFWGPKFFYERYGKPIMITENGLSVRDVVSLDGKVHDPTRIDFLNRYLLELRDVADEVPVDAYFQWSIMDNFEWNEGYKHRFGLVYIDFESKERIIKDSGYFYKETILTNGQNL